MILLLLLLIAPAHAAEATMPIQASIIRCVTQEEIIKACHERMACCELIDSGDPPDDQEDDETGPSGPFLME